MPEYLITTRRKPTEEWSVVCSGKDKPWHLEGQNRTHRHLVKKVTKVQATLDDLNDDENLRTPIARECAPWKPQKRTITQWENVDE